jgi:hypothetical protein
MEPARLVLADHQRKVRGLWGTNFSVAALSNGSGRDEEAIAG